ncbi:MAG: carbohydrate kinase family protein [Gemmatimonadetes bacterium]|nr:carbohydrate kinase family protein [Gemmatimonadota bacterium]
MPRVGVLGSLVWDEIHGRDPLAAPVEEWGGIAYALAAMDAALPADWEMVPLIKVGADLAPKAAEFYRSLQRLAPGTRPIEVPVPNNRVTLRYESTDRRCEQMAGGVPGWTWPELGPMVADLDALYVNFISGFECCLFTAQQLGHGFTGPIYADLHSLFLAKGSDGMRSLQPLPDAAAWLGCFDCVQLNEDEMLQLAADPLVVSAEALRAGVSLLTVTVGPRGAIYVARPGFDRLADLGNASLAAAGGAVRTALLAPPAVDAIDPTGCGDVFGATCFAHLLAGDDVAGAVTAANRAAARNAAFRGATFLARQLRGDLVLA